MSKTDDKIIAGALFDFLGYLTTRDKPTYFGSTEWAAPAVDLLTEWAKTRSLSLDDPAIADWHKAQQPAASGEPVARLERGEGGAFKVRPDMDNLLAIYALPPGGHALYAAPQPAPDAALRTAVRLVLDATPDQLPMALDALRDHASATQPAPARVPLTDERLNAAGLDYALADSFRSGSAEWVAQDIADAFRAGARAAERHHGITAKEALAAAPDAQKGEP